MYDVETGFRHEIAKTLPEAITLAVIMYDPYDCVSIIDESGQCVWHMHSQYAEEVERLTNEARLKPTTPAP